MSLFMILRIALKALARNKMRTVLTMLGMIIGVAAVITMVALGGGAQFAIEEQIRRCPEQWVWFHRRWRHQPADPDAPPAIGTPPRRRRAGAGPSLREA